MCGRFTLKTPANQLLLAFGLSSGPPLVPRYNVAPTQEIPIIRAGEGGRELSMMHWGLIPGWSKQPDAGGRLINARAETVAEKPAFRTSFQRRRCLVPADGYYEWVAAGKKKQPYWIHRADEQPFAFAGLWDQWRPEAGEPLVSCTIVTTDANAATREIHDRMPVILDPADYDLWLDPTLSDSARLLPLLRPYEGDELRVDAVSTFVNSAHNEGPECLDPGEKTLF
jgi:putative SOS response-associated peptidase YedK